MWRDRRRGFGRAVLVAAHAAALAVVAHAGGAQADARGAAAQPEGYRVIVSVERRRLWVVANADTLLEARVAVGKGTTLRYGDEVWRFDTPRGVRTVLAKEANPAWVPPDWYYIETARREGLRLRWLSVERPAVLADGRALAVRGGVVGVVDVVDGDSVFRELPRDEHVVFDGTLWVPPIGTRNRQVPGVLGAYRLVLGDGLGLHGTNEPSSVGRRTTHGCMRLSDADIAWLYDHVPVGTRVYIY